jgi:hypothetical protein
VRDAKRDSFSLSLSLSSCSLSLSARFGRDDESPGESGDQKKEKKKFTPSNHKNVAPGSLFVSVRVRSEDDDENVFFYHLSDHVLFASE